MARRPEPTKPGFVINGTGTLDQSIKDKPGIVYGINVSWTGATAGDLIHIEDALSASASNRRIHTIRIDAAAGKYNAVLPAVGVPAQTGIWLNAQLGGANVAINVDYD
jgi:hypothetical protein